MTNLADLCHPDTERMAQLIDAARELAFAGRKPAARDQVALMHGLDDAAWRACTPQLDRLFDRWPWLLDDDDCGTSIGAGVFLGAACCVAVWLVARGIR